MSRHRRQQLKRANRALEQVPRATVSREADRFMNTGLLPRWLTAVERLAVHRELKRRADAEECVF